MRIASLITAINVFVASGFAITGLVNPASMLPTGVIAGEASSMFAMYAAARAIPLAVIAFVIIYKRSTSALIVIGTLAGAIQLADTLIGMLMQEPMKIFGPLAIAVLQFYAIFMLAKSNHQNSGN